MGDYVDKRGGAYDPVNATGNPQPAQVRDKQTPSQKAQWGADVRPEPMPGQAARCGYSKPERHRPRFWRKPSRQRAHRKFLGTIPSLARRQSKP